MGGSSNRQAIAGVTPTASSALTALAGGGLTVNTTPLLEEFNRVTTCATIGDSVLLPVSTAGLSVNVTNTGAAACDIFPQTGEAINALAVSTAIRLNTQSTLRFQCNVAGTWQTAPILPIPAKFTSLNVAGPATLSAGVITGAAIVTVLSTNAAPGSLTTRTATQMFADAGNVQPGDAYFLHICNSGAGTLTLLAGAGVTFGTGTYTVPTATSRTFLVTYTTATAIAFNTISVGTWT